jgi:hypothetical protein
MEKLSDQELGIAVRRILHSDKNQVSRTQAINRLEPLCDPVDTAAEPEPEPAPLPPQTPAASNEGGGAPDTGPVTTSKKTTRKKSPTRSG